MAILMRTWRALLKVVTTRLFATRDSFAMTMSVMACTAQLYVFMHGAPAMMRFLRVHGLQADMLGT